MTRGPFPQVSARDALASLCTLSQRPGCAAGRQKTRIRRPQLQPYSLFPYLRNGDIDNPGSYFTGLRGPFGEVTCVKAFGKQMEGSVLSFFPPPPHLMSSLRPSVDISMLITDGP